MIMRRKQREEVKWRVSDEASNRVYTKCFLETESWNLTHLEGIRGRLLRWYINMIWTKNFLACWLTNVRYQLACFNLTDNRKIAFVAIFQNIEYERLNKLALS